MHPCSNLSHLLLRNGVADIIPNPAKCPVVSALVRQTVCGESRVSI